MITRDACIHDPVLLGILVAANLVIWLAYMLISGILVWVQARAGKVPFPSVWWMFAAFINGCGWTHFCAALVFFRTAYHLEAAVCAVTAIISTTTGGLLFIWRKEILGALSDFSRLAESVEKERPE